MLRKFIITVICCMSIFALCTVPSFAATMSDKEMAIEQISLCWQTSTSSKNVVSFDSLTSLCADLNRNGYPCEIRFVSSLNGYAILGTGYVHNTFESGRVYSLSGKYYSNIEGSIFYSPYQSDSLLSGISTYISTISTTVTTISDNLGYFRTNVQNSLVQIYTKLTGISDSVSIGVGHLNSINNYLSEDLTAYLQDINSSAAGANTSLGLIATKLDSVVNTLTTENGKNALFYPITRRLDSIISAMGSSTVDTGSLRYWRVSDDTIGSLHFSNIGYDALSSLMASATESYLDFQVVSDNTLYYLDTVQSFSIVHTTIGDTTGYFIQCVGKYRQSVNGVNQFYDGVFYLTEKNGTIFYASDDSHASAFDDTAILSGITTVNDNITGFRSDIFRLFDGYETLYLFPQFNSSTTSSTWVYGASSNGFRDVPHSSDLYYSSAYRIYSRTWSGNSTGSVYDGAPAQCYPDSIGFTYYEELDVIEDVLTIDRTISFYSWDGTLVTLPNVSCRVLGGLAIFSFYPKWDDSGTWLGWYKGRTLLSTDNEPTVRLLSSRPASEPYYIYGSSSTAQSVVCNGLFVGFLQGQFNSVLNAIGSAPVADLSTLEQSMPGIESTLSSIDSKLNNLPASSGSDLTNIESALSTIIDKMDNLPASVENIVVNITEDNDAYNIFYVEDENGDKKSVTSVAGDSLSASGKLLQFLYKLIIGSAISDVDNSIGGLNDFFFDNAPSGLEEGVTVWD